MLPERLDERSCRLRPSVAPLAAMSPLHLTTSMRVIKTHEGGRVTIGWAKRRVAEAAAAEAAKSADRDLLLLAAKLERACGCSIVELAKIAEAWEP
jgi:hypothetical protein